MDQSFFTYKVLAYLEMFLYSAVLNLRLIKYTYQIKPLCFNSLVVLNNAAVHNPFRFIGLYDHFLLLNKCHYYLAFQQYNQSYFSKAFTNFFKVYNQKFRTYRLNKMWLLNNALKNKVPEGLIFEHLNVMIYSAPFRRITAIFFNVEYYDEFLIKGTTGLQNNVQHAVIKTRLFEYANFYK